MRGQQQKERKNITSFTNDLAANEMKSSFKMSC